MIKGGVLDRMNTGCTYYFLDDFNNICKQENGVQKEFSEVLDLQDLIDDANKLVNENSELKELLKQILESIDGKLVKAPLMDCDCSKCVADRLLNELKEDIIKKKLKNEVNKSMGLDIMSSDDEKNFHIGYISFSTMRSLFILHYSTECYNDYNNVLRGIMHPTSETERLYNKIFTVVGDLSILIDHSDCDGRLTSSECKQLRPCLFVDEEKIHNESTVENNEYYNHIISKMYEFIELVDYSIDYDVDLIFG